MALMEMVLAVASPWTNKDLSGQPNIVRWHARLKKIALCSLCRGVCRRYGGLLSDTSEQKTKKQKNKKTKKQKTKKLSQPVGPELQCGGTWVPPNL